MAALFLEDIVIVMEASQVVEVINGNCTSRMAAAVHHVMNVWAVFFQVGLMVLGFFFSLHFVSLCLFGV